MNKNYIALFALVIDTQSYATEMTGTDSSAMCSAPATTDSIDALASDVKEVECDQLNQANSCISRNKIDADRRAKLIQSFGALDEIYRSSKGNLTLQKKSYDLYKDLNEQFGEAYLATRVSVKTVDSHSGSLQKLNATTYRQRPTNQQIQMRSYYHQFLKRSQQDGNFAQHTENFTDDYLGFESHFECQQGVELDLVSTNVIFLGAEAKNIGMDNCEENKTNYERKLAQNRSTVESFYQEYYHGEKGLDRGLSCDPKVEIGRAH